MIRSQRSPRPLSLGAVRPVDEPPSDRPGCSLCGRPTFDPDKRDRPWVRAVTGGRQVLVCPACQTEHEDWASRLDRCEACGSTRLSAMLGQVVCRACGHSRAVTEAGA